MSDIISKGLQRPKGYCCETIELKVIRLGGLYDTPERKHEAGSMYDPKGLSPTITTCRGGYRMPLIVVKVNREN